MIPHRGRQPLNIVIENAIQFTADIKLSAVFGHSETSCAIEILEREPNRVGNQVAPGTDRIGVVDIKPLTSG